MYFHAVLREIIWTFRYAQLNRLSVCDALPPTVDATRLPWYQYWLQADTNGEISTTRAITLAQEIVEETRKAAAMDAARRNMLDLSQTIANWK